MKKTFLLIPGNPAVARDYQSWMKEIEQQYPHIYMVYATSYVMFDKKLSYIEYDRAMRQHYEDVLLELNSSEKISIIAHSVGSYFAFRLLEKYPEKIEKVTVMFPYIGYSTLPSLRFVSIPYWIDRFLPLAEIVARYKNLFRRSYGNVNDISNTELAANLRFGVRQCAYFNKYKLDTHIISNSKEKILFLYRDNDKWCPVETTELLKPISIHKKIALPHDFIQTSEHRMSMIRELGINS